MDKFEAIKQEAREIVRTAETLDTAAADLIYNQSDYLGSPITFANLKTLNPFVAHQLSRVRVAMNFPNLREIDAKTARALLGGQSREIVLDGVESVSVEVVKAFISGQRSSGTRLFLTGLKAVSPAVARQLKKCAFTSGEVKKAVDSAPSSLLDEVFDVLRRFSASRSESYESQDIFGYLLSVALIVSFITAIASCVSRPSGSGPSRPSGDYDGFRPSGPSRFTD
jgi:hypothetical protein